MSKILSILSTSSLSSIALLAVLVLCIACVAFFSSSETAFLSLTAARVQSLKVSGRRFSLILAKLHAHIERLLTLILIGTNFCANMASSLGTTFIVAILGDRGAFLSTFIVAFLSTTFGQIIPKSLALADPERTALRRALPLSILQKLLFPLVAIFGFFAKLIKSEKKATDPSREELDTLFEIALRDEVIPKSSKAILSKALDFANLRAQDVVTTEKGIESVAVTAGRKEVIKKFSDTGVKSLGVVDSAGRIIAVTSYKDTLLSRGALHYTPAIFVSPEEPLMEVLKTLSAAQSRIAFVRTLQKNAEQKVLGVLTIDSILKAACGALGDN